MFNHCIFRWHFESHSSLVSAFDPLRTLGGSEIVGGMRVSRLVSWLSYLAGFVGLSVSFLAQWLMFRPGNFSEGGGPIYIPLGEHGIYTSKALGLAWYGGLVAFAIFELGPPIYRAIRGLSRNP